MTILYDAIENTVANTIKATYTVCTAQDAKVERDTVEYTMAFLYSDRLYFLWHCTKRGTTMVVLWYLSILYN